MSHKYLIPRVRIDGSKNFKTVEKVTKKGGVSAKTLEQKISKRATFLPKMSKSATFLQQMLKTPCREAFQLR